MQPGILFRVLFVCALVTTASGPAIAGPLAEGSPAPSAQAAPMETLQSAEATQATATEIDSCTAITESGTYVLGGDLQNDTRESCIRIRASDVVLDGNGYAITGGESELNVGQFVDGSFQGQLSATDERWRQAGVLAQDVSNVTVRNVETTGWLVGVSLVNVSDGVVRNVTAREDGFGVVLAGGTNGTVAGTNATSTAGAGIFLLASRNGTVVRSEASENGLFGVYLHRTADANVTATTASRNDIAGILFESATDATVRGSIASENGVTGVYLIGSNASTVVNVTTLENRQIGVYLRDTDTTTVRNVEANANAIGVVLEDAQDSTVVNSTANLNRRIGIAAFDSDRSRVVDSIASSNDFAGVYVVASDDFAVRETRATQDAIGLVFENATNGSVSGGTYEQNARTGLTLFNATHTRVAAVDASRNDYHGVFLVNSSNNTVTGANASYNGLSGVFLRNATNNTVSNNTLLANALAGVYEEDTTGNRIADNRDGTTPFPSTDGTIGREGGISHDEDIEINQTDGLNDSEIRRYVYRTIARAEYIRGLEYNETVDVEVITRSENRRRTLVQPDDSGAASAWRNQVWEAPFLIGEDANASTELDQFRGERVLGYYLPPADKLVIVTDDEGGGVDSVTLVHELTHALQDQHFDLAESSEQARTEDAQRARSGLVEGDASHVDAQFQRLCGAIWNCVETESTSPISPKIPEINLGVRRILGQPYSDGPGYVEHLRQSADGWTAVNDAYDDLPNSSEQIIHPGRANEDPIPIDFENEPTNGWTGFNATDLPFEGINGTTTLGEAGIYTMFWYQAIEHDIPVVDPQTHFVPEGGAFDSLNYTSAPSAGWGNDVLVPYQKGNQSAYVWVTEWDTAKDARQFHEAYVQMLRGHDATREAPRVWVIPDGPFEDAFHVVRRGKTVTITNAPEVSDLSDVRPGIRVRGSQSNGNETAMIGT